MGVEKYIINSLHQLLREGIEDFETLNDTYIKRRIPFFKSFENKSGGREVRFEHFKNWQGNDSAVLHFGKGGGYVEFPFLSIEVLFIYYTQRKRNFKAEEELIEFRPLFDTQHNFTFSADVHMDLPKTQEDGDVGNQIVSLVFKEMMKNEFKFQDSFIVRDGEQMPQKLDSIINEINGKCFKIEETLGKMNLNFF